jgi:hypothetical protein
MLEKQTFMRIMLKNQTISRKLKIPKTDSNFYLVVINAFANRGLKLDSKGKVKTYTTEQQLLSPFNKDNNIKSLPFNRGLKPLEDYMKKNQSHPLSKAAADVRKGISEIYNFRCN